MIEIASILIVVLYGYLAFCSAYYLFFSFSGTFLYRNKKEIDSVPKTKFTVLFPCYKNDEVALHSIAEALKQDYPPNLFEVFLIADGFKPESVAAAKRLGATVLEVKFEVSTKAQAINAALAQADFFGDYVVILDVDNVMASGALLAFNKSILSGSKAIQAHRTAKNLDTPFAILDALSEEINNTIFRKGQTAVGLTSAIIGSGMVFEKQLLTQLMLNATAVGGFDKELEFELINNGIRVAYLNSVEVFDEKVQHMDVLKNQRRRWISAQWFYFVKFFPKGVFSLFTGNVQLFFKAIQLGLLPRIIHLGLVGLYCLGTVIWYMVDNRVNGLPALLLGTVTMLALLLAIPRKFYTLSTTTAIGRLPLVMFSFFRILFRLKGANKTFIHTPHKVSSK